MMKYIGNFFSGRKKELEDESGAVVIIVTASMIILLLVTAFVIDFGHLYVENSKLQNACDAAARAAALVYDSGKTGSDKTVNHAAVRQQAARIMKENGYIIEDSDVEINETDSTVTVTKVCSVNIIFAKIINIDKMNTKKSATASVTGGKKKLVLDYALFSGSTSVSLPIYGSTDVTGGNVHTNCKAEFVGTGGSFSVSKKFTYVQNTDGSGTISTGSAAKTGTELMPDYHDAFIGALPKETEYVTYNDIAAYVNANSDKLVGNTLTIDSNVKINNFGNCSYAVTVTGNLLINSKAEFEKEVTVTNRGSIRVLSGEEVEFKDDFSLNGYLICQGTIKFNVRMLGITNHTQSVIYSVNGDVKVEGYSNTVYGVFYVPNGEFSVKDGYSIQVTGGGIIADKIKTPQGGSLKIDANPSVAFDDDVLVTSGSGGSGGTIKLIK